MTGVGVITASDAQLNEAMDRYAGGDGAAFGVVYERLAPRLLAFLRRGTPDALAEELLQQTFLQMHLARERYRTGLDVVPWAFAIARRLRIDLHRKSGREVGGDEAPESASRDPSPHDALAARETASTLQRGLSELPQSQREAFELVKSAGLSHAQAAEALGTSVTAIKVRVHRACEALRVATSYASGEDGKR